MRLDNLRRLEITTMHSCVIDCAFCPQTVYQQKYNQKKDLTLEDFKLALSNVPKDVVIEFAGFSEPFLNPQCLSMVQFADKEGYRIIIDTTLTGLTPEGIKTIAKCNILAFSLHLPDNKGNAQIPFNTQNYKETLVACLSNICIHSFSVMNDNFVSNERAGNCKDVPSRNKRGLIICRLGKLRYPQPVMLPNGELVLCCMDWALTCRLGNLLTSSYDDLTANLKIEKICRRCTYAEPSPKYALRKVSLGLYQKLRI